MLEAIIFLLNSTPEGSNVGSNNLFIKLDTGGVECWKEIIFSLPDKLFVYKEKNN